MRLALPALGTLAAEPLYVVVDSVIVGQLGTAPLAGLGAAGAILTTGFLVFNFLAYGTTGAVARAFGAGAKAEAARNGIGALWLGIVIGAALLVVGAWMTPSALTLLGVDASVRPFATTYLRISMVGAPAVMIALAGIGFSRGMQDTRRPLFIVVTANVINVVLECVAVFVLDLGVAGSAWATVIAQWGAAIAFAYVLISAARAQGVSLRPTAGAIRACARVGGHLIVRTASLLGGLAVASSVAARLGAVALAAHHVTFLVWSFLALVLDAIAIAAQAMIGRMLGAGDAVAARAAARRMIWWGVVAGSVLGAAVALARPLLAGLFSADPDVRGVLSTLLIIVAAMQPLNGVVFVLDGVLIGAGDGKYLSGAMFGASVIVLVPGALIVGTSGTGLVWLWAVIAAFMGARLAGLWWRFRSEGWSVTGMVVHRTGPF